MNFFSVVRQQLDKIVHLLQEIVTMLKSQTPDYAAEDKLVKDSQKAVSEAKDRIPTERK